MKRITKNKNWIYWFIGFCDAEGNFQTSLKKRINLTKDITYNIGYSFHLSLSIIDHELLQNIHLNLNNLGNYYKYLHRNEVRISMTKIDNLKWLITNIFEISPLLTKHQRNNSFSSRLKYGILNKFNRVENIKEFQDYYDKTYSINLSNLLYPYSTNKIIFDNWMSGFINGEGSFVIHSKGYLVFYIEQIESEVLVLIKNRLEAGPNILLRPSRGINRKNTYSLFLSSKKDIGALIKFFDKKKNPYLIPLCGNKLIQFNKWKEFYYNSGKYC